VTQTDRFERKKNSKRFERERERKNRNIDSLLFACIVCRVGANHTRHCFLLCPLSFCHYLAVCKLFRKDRERRHEDRPLTKRKRECVYDDFVQVQNIIQHNLSMKGNLNYVIKKHTAKRRKCFETKGPLKKTHTKAECCVSYLKTNAYPCFKNLLFLDRSQRMRERVHNSKDFRSIGPRE
jgi:hypothetical protein